MDDRYDKLKSFKVSREVERETGLSELKKGQQREYSFMEDKHREYLLQQALRKAFASGKKNRYFSFFTADEIKSIRRQAMKNPDMESFLGDRKDLICQELTADKFFKTLYKDELMKKLEAIYEEHGKGSFLREVKNSGLYVRYTKGSLVYGLPDCSFYMKEQNMPPIFSCQSLKGAEQPIEGKEKERIFSVLCQSNGSIRKLIKQGILVRDGKGRILDRKSKPDGRFGDFSFCDCSGAGGQPVWITGDRMAKKLGKMDFKDITDSRIFEMYAVSPVEEYADTTSLRECLSNGLRSRFGRVRLDEIIGGENRDFILDSMPCDRQIKALLTGEQYAAVDEVLYAEGFYNSLNRERLLSVLDAAPDIMKIQDYCNQNGIVMNILEGKNPSLSYTILDSSNRKYTFFENRLPKNYCYRILKPYLSAPRTIPVTPAGQQLPGFVPSGTTRISPEEQHKKKSKGKGGTQIGDLYRGI